MILRFLCASAVVVSLLAPAPAAAAPSPLDPILFGFPGSLVAPASGGSASLALGDRWLGDEPYANPAVPGGFRVEGSGALLHPSRQDLRARNREFDETPAFFEGASATIGLPSFRALSGALYAYQPVLRQEDNAFSRGLGTPDPANPPGAVETQARAREVRAGFALSAGIGETRLGAAVEWSRREDHYRKAERSGAPTAGNSQLDFDGEAVGFQLGGRFDRGDTLPGAFSVGAGFRYLPALPMDATHAETLLVDTVRTAFAIERAAAWEAGVSGRYVVSPAFRVVAGVGGRAEQRWEGLDLTAGAAWEWKLGGEFSEPAGPWAVRFAIGQEHQSDVPEPKANVLGLGFGLRFATGTVDLGLLHRTLHRDGMPNSFDDRVVLSLRTTL